MTELIGRTLAGRYEIINLLGHGGMAEVYRARHIQLDRFVAVKVMLDYLTHDANFKARFEREARLVARLQHPHIIQVFDYDAIEAENLYYMVVELINGPSLADILSDLHDHGEHLPLDDVIRIVGDVASALGYAHQQGMMHRDVKPSNVLIDGGKRVVLTDFGVARIVASDQDSNKLTTTGTVLGTPAYMAPEVGTGESGDARSDLYSLGIMLYQMLTGEVPFQASTPIAVILKHLNEPVASPRRSLPDLPPGIENVTLRLLAKDPADRYQSADELIADLDDLQNVPAYTSRRRPGTIRLPEANTTLPTRRPRRLVMASTALLILVVLAGSLLFFGRSVLLGSAPTSTRTALPSPTLSPSPTNTALPALMETPVDSPGAPETQAPINTDIPSPVACTVVAATQLVRLRFGPGMGWGLDGVFLNPGETAIAIGNRQNFIEQQTWWYIQKNDQSQGWASAKDLTLNGDCLALPTLEIPTIAPSPLPDTPIPPPDNSNPAPPAPVSNNPGPTAVPPDTPVPDTAVPDTAVPDTPAPQDTPVSALNRNIAFAAHRVSKS